MRAASEEKLEFAGARKGLKDEHHLRVLRESDPVAATHNGHA